MPLFMRFYLEMFLCVGCKITGEKIMKRSQVLDCQIAIQKRYSKLQSFNSLSKYPSQPTFTLILWFLIYSKIGHLIMF